MEPIKGTLVAHGPLGFVYRYTCERCGIRFQEVQVPDLNPPCLCHGCATGTRGGLRPGGKKRRRTKPGGLTE